MRFFVLGPLGVEKDGKRVNLGHSRQRIVLAALLLEPNRTVTVNRLVTALYGSAAPVTARSQVQVCVSGLRRALGAGLIATIAPGYALRIDEDSIDGHRFETLLPRARQARVADRPREAAALYREALGLWKGPVLDGLGGTMAHTAANRLTELRVTATEESIDLELDLGDHHRLVAELTTLVRIYPLRERFREQIMTALYRCGRSDEALEIYRRTCEVWAEELGLEPTERLSRLAHAIRAGGPLTGPERPGRIRGGSLAELARAPLPRGGTYTGTTGGGCLLGVGGSGSDRADGTRADGRRGDSSRAGRDPTDGRATSGRVPADTLGLLPAALPDFTGRTDQLAQTRACLVANRPRRAVPLVVMVGQAGIGKTSLAVQATHDLAEEFPDGRLFASLQGASGNPASPSRVLEHLLTALGLHAEEIPDGLDERAETYRDMVAARRMLIVLDDVGGESQVLPLLPGGAGASVLLTSRRRLSGLAGAAHVEVPVFDLDQSVRLLSRVAGAERPLAEPDATAALAEMCGHLPLALRIAGARLAAYPDWTVEHLVERLQDDTKRLDELKYGDMRVRAGITLSYESLGQDSRRLFRRLAIPNVPVFPAWVGAALLDRSLSDTDDLLADLADAQLIEAVGASRGLETRYRFHDLIRVFAKERLAAEEPAADRGAALARMLDGLLAVVQAARHRHCGGAPERHTRSGGGAGSCPLSPRQVGRLVEAPLTWLERERLLVMSGVRQAERAGLAEICYDLTAGLAPLLEAKGYLDDWRESHEVALEAAERMGIYPEQIAILSALKGRKPDISPPMQYST